MSSLAKARPVAWGRGRFALRPIHWLLIVLNIGVALAVAAPNILSQPLLFLTTAEVTVDTTRYTQIFNEQGKLNGRFKDPRFPDNIEKRAWERLGGEFNRFGSPTLNVIDQDLGALNPPQPGHVRFTAFATDAAISQRLADRAAERVVQQIRALNGRELLNQLLDNQESALLGGRLGTTQSDRELQALIRVGAFDFRLAAGTHPLTPSPDDLADITRALEVRYDEVTGALGQVDLPAAERARLIGIQKALQPILLRYQKTFRGSDIQASPAYVSQTAPLPVAPQDRRLPLKFGLVALAGLISGLLTVLVDRGVGIVPKLRELWGYRDLIRNLVVRDLKARYKGSMLGYFWSLVNPLLFIVIFFVVFKLLFHNDIAFFHIFLMAALLPWNYTVGAVSEGVGSIVGNGSLVKKVFFPREILPIATVISNLINFLLALPMLFLVMALTGATFSWTILFVPVLIVIQTLFLAGLVMSLSATAVFFRDTQHIVGILIQLWFFLTPVFYSLKNTVSAELARYIRWFNPMASLADFYRDVLYGGVAFGADRPTPGLPSLDGVARTALTALVVLAFGVYVFNRASRRFAEEL